MTYTNLRGRVAIVTGASRERGIGAAVCRALAERGADILFSHWRAFDRAMPHGADEDLPTALLRELRSAGVRAEAIEIDLAAPDAAERTLDAAVECLGVPTIVVNNAAHSVPDSVETLDASILDAHYAVNIRSPVLLSAGFARRWPGGPGGRIINFVSGQSLAPMPDTITYATTKGALETFTRTFSAAVAARGITVNAVHPGPTDTGWMTDEVRAELLARFPLGRLGQPEDAARLVAFLAGDDAAWITGQVFHSEGGFVRG